MAMEIINFRTDLPLILPDVYISVAIGAIMAEWKVHICCLSCWLLGWVERCMIQNNTWHTELVVPLSLVVFQHGCRGSIHNEQCNPQKRYCKILARYLIVDLICSYFSFWLVRQFLTCVRSVMFLRHSIVSLFQSM